MYLDAEEREEYGLEPSTAKRMPEQWEEPVGKTEPIEKTAWIRATITTSNPDLVVRPTHYLDTLVFRDDLNKHQKRMAQRDIDNLKCALRVGWLREG